MKLKNFFQRKLKTIKPDHDYEIRRPRRAISGTYYSYPNALKAYDFSCFISKYLNQIMIVNYPGLRRLFEEQQAL